MGGSTGAAKNSGATRTARSRRGATSGAVTVTGALTVTVHAIYPLVTLSPTCSSPAAPRSPLPGAGRGGLSHCIAAATQDKAYRAQHTAHVHPHAYPLFLSPHAYPIFLSPHGYPRMPIPSWLPLCLPPHPCAQPQLIDYTLRCTLTVPCTAHCHTTYASRP